ncbi:MAG: hypothetical protein ACYDEC_02945 [Bacteroidia bacterium]
MRYKIVFALPFVDQKHLLHGHSHFAFAGWITQALMVLLVTYLYQHGLKDSFKKYAWLLIGNLLTAYGMLLTFPIEGYGLFSITFSTLSIFVSYFFAYIFWKDLNKINGTPNSHLWFKAAIIFNAISSLGAFSLAIMMARHVVWQNLYLSSVYFYLHFQYNGWFFFACMGLLISKLQDLQIMPLALKNIFWLFLIACVPAYFLSAPWIPLPFNLSSVYVLAALAQVFAWVLFLKIILNNLQILNKNISSTGKWLLSLSAIALTIKLLLQAASTYPPLGQLAFGFRPIVIGYLHLVLLGVVTIFLIGYIVINSFITLNRKTNFGILIFISGILINEFLLMLQGVSALNNETIPYTNELLLLAAVIMFSGLILIVTFQFRLSKKLQAAT